MDDDKKVSRMAVVERVEGDSPASFGEGTASTADKAARQAWITGWRR